MIDAETEGQRRVAVKAAEGEVRRRLEELRKGVIKALAKVEALIDFGEGEEIEEGVYDGGGFRHFMTGHNLALEIERLSS